MGVDVCIMEHLAADDSVGPPTPPIPLWEPKASGSLPESRRVADDGAEVHARLKQVCFLGGSAHSGSTLLGLMLGSHPSVFYAGEARNSGHLGDTTVPRRKRVCKMCGDDCPVWGPLVSRSTSKLYETLSATTERSVLVDSSKNIDWVEPRAAELAGRGVTLRFMTIHRDGRAVLASRLRKPDKYPGLSVVEHCEDWVKRVCATRELALRFPGEVTELRYERLCTRPEEEMRRVVRWMGFSFDPAMLHPWSAEHHPLSGSPGSESLVAREQGLTRGAVELDDRHRSHYAQHPPAVVLDLRWREELSPSALAEFERTAGETNAPYAWGE